MAQVLSTNVSVPFVDFPASDASMQYYRLKSPGLQVTDALAEWQATQPSSYQYWFERRAIALGPADLRGLVTVSNGAKEVSSVSTSGEPTDEFNPEDFLTPGELFDRLAMLESSGIRLAHVIHDKTWGFPAKVLEISGFDPIVEYHIIDFVDTSDQLASDQDESAGTSNAERSVP